MNRYSVTIELFRKLTYIVYNNFKLIHTKQEFIELVPYSLEEIDYNKYTPLEEVSYDKFPGELSYSFELIIENVFQVLVDISFIKKSLVNFRSMYFFQDASYNEIIKLKEDVIIPSINSLSNENPWFPFPGMSNDVVFKSYSDKIITINTIYSSSQENSAISIYLTDQKYSF